MTTKAVQEGTVSAKLIERWEQVCQKLTVLAEVVPENRFDYSPVEGVRTFADVLRHVAFWNRHLADSARGRKGDDTANELPKDEFSTKTRIIDALKHSAASATDALKENSSGLSPDVAEMVVTFIEHTCEHYGQLVVYARLNGIIPPASRE
ncbi:MAG TPA: DinB family protein [Candidatus Acidoferrum sp.]